MSLISQISPICLCLRRFLSGRVYITLPPKLQRLFKRTQIAVRYTTVFALIIITVFGPLFYLTLQKPKTASAAWFDENWDYRKAIAVTNNTTAETNVYISATIATNDTTKFQVSCGDLRFTKQNGELLPYYVYSGCQTASTVVHVFFDTFPAGTQTIYYYYGNPSATNGFSSSDFSTVASNYTIGSIGTEEQSPGPAAYWKFDEGYGQTASDSTSDKTNGTFGASTTTGTDDPTWQTEDQCVAGKCLYFDGSDYVQFPDNGSTDINGDKTIGFWIRTNTTSASRVIDKYTSGNGYVSILNTNGTVTFQSVVTGGATSTSTVAVNDGKWHYLTFVFDASATQYIYVDGTLSDSDSITASNLSNSDTLYFATNDGSSTFLTGFLDEVKIYPYARTAAQIKTDYAGRGTSKGSTFTQGGTLTQLSNGLVGYWKTDEATWSGTLGEVIDSSGNANHGQAQGPANGKPYTTGGKFGNGGKFDGVNDTVTITDNNILDLGTGDFAVSYWFYVDNALSTNTEYGVVNKNSTYENSAGWGTEVHTWGAAAGKFTTSFYITTQTVWGNALVASQATWNVNQWYHFVGLRSGTTAKLFIDGVLISSGTNSQVNSSVNNALNITIGDHSWGPNFPGRIDELRIYNRALSPAEVRQLADWAPGPVGYWDFEEGSGGTVYDKGATSSASLNNGTWNGTGTTHWVSGKLGKAGKFNGADDVVTVGTNTIIGTGTAPFTASAWIYSTKTLTNGQWYFPFRLKQTTQFFFSFYQTGGVLYVLPVFRGSTQWATIINQSTIVNTWNHLTVIYNGGDKSTASSYETYINGVKIAVGSVNLGTAGGSCNDNAIGSDADASCVSNMGQFQGTIDEVRVYNYARSAKQIVEDMNAGHPSVGSPIGSAVGYWKFDEGQGTYTNNSGSQGETLRGSLGVGSSAPTWTNEGKFGKALSFDGSNKYVDVGNNSALQLNDSFTASAWIKISGANSGNSIQTVVSKFNSNGVSRRTFSLGVDSNYMPWFTTTTDGGSSYTATNPSYVLSLNTWYHYVGVLDLTTQIRKVYINGVPVGSTSSVGSTLYQNTTDNAMIGKVAGNSGGYNLFFNGVIDEVKVYNYALTADEVKTEYNRGSALVLGSFSNTSGLTGGSVASNSASAVYCIPGDTAACSSPVGEWDFEEGKDNTCSGGANDVCDKSGRGNDGAWNGTGTSHWVSGKLGKSGNFNGSNDYVSITSLTATGGNYTFEFWAKPDILNASGYDFFIDIQTGRFVLGRASTLYQFYDGSWKDFGSGVAHSSYKGNWHHYSFVFNSSNTTAYLYIDGILKGSNNTYSSKNLGGNISFMSRYDNSNYQMKGSLDQVRIFDYARTPAQIAWDYNRGGAIGWWKFDECQGTIAYDSGGLGRLGGSGNNGTITIGATGSQTTLGTCTTPVDGTGAWYNGSTGKYNHSMSFDGTDDYITTVDDPLDVTGDITVSAWMKGTNVSEVKVIASKYNSTADAGWLLLSNTSGKAGFDGRTGASTYYSSGRSSTTVTDGNWHHLAGVRSGSTFAIYVDGVFQSSASGGSGSFANAKTLDIGRNTDGSGSNYFNGQIDDAQIFNYALTATQIKNLFNHGSGVRFGPSQGTP